MSFDDLARLNVDQTFATLGAPAIYEALTSPNPEAFAAPVTVTVLPTTRDAIVAGFSGTSTITDERLFEVRVSEIAEPVRNSRMTIGGIVYRISNAPHRRDKRGLKWTFGCKKDRNS